MCCSEAVVHRPQKYSQIVMSIETQLDTKELTNKEVTPRLKVVDDHDDMPPPSTLEQLLLSSSKLYFTKEQ